MGRKERRYAERQQRIEERKGKMLLSKADVQEIADDVCKCNVEDLMTCFALAEHRLYGFGKTRILRTLQYIDELMGPITSGECSIEDYKKIVEEETNIKIVCE